MKSFCLVIPSLGPGGTERVMIELAEWFAQQKELKIFLIALTKKKIFYRVPPEVTFYEPNFEVGQHIRIVTFIRTLFFLRQRVRIIKPHYLLSFGGKYNSFVLLSVCGLPINTFISERSQPSISYGWFLDRINPIVYRRASGIIAQTNMAKEAIYKKTYHPRIEVIGNPIRIEETSNSPKENIILNVGRFIPSKGQLELLRIFEAINYPDWKLVFLGDGPDLEKAKQISKQLENNLNIEFHGFVQNVRKFYMQSKIFAFTSSSEGFPNALAEAMAFGLSCISYDCEAGPSELIENGKSGYLVRVNDQEDYKYKLKLLMDNKDLRKEFGDTAKEKVKEFDLRTIGKKYLDSILKS